MKTLENKQKSTGTFFAILCAFLIMFVSMGFTSSPKSLFLKAITEDLGIKRSLFSFNDSARYIATAILSVYFGTLIQKFGTKKLIMVGFLLLISSMALYAVSSHLLMFYLAGMFMGAGLSFLGSTMAGYIVKRRCKKNVGTVQGFVMAANGLGGAVATQFVTPMIESGRYGVRKAYWGVVIVLAVTAVLVMILYREDRSTPNAPVAGKKARGQVWEGMTYQEAKKRSYYLPLSICIFLTGFVLSGINGISTAHMRDVGIDPAFVANIWSIHSLLLMAFKFSTGVVYDWKGLRVTLLMGQITAILVLVALALSSTSTMGVTMATVYAIFSGLALPLETMGVTLITGDMFGNKRSEEHTSELQSR